MLRQMHEELDKLFPEMVKIRRDLHQYPELSFEEVETPRKVAEYLRQAGLEVKEGVGGSGVVGFLKGGKPGRTVALRADFDALPIQDEKDVSYKSSVPGVMHACGHDLHTAALLATAKVLVKYRDDVAGNVVFIHQFAEERYPGGAQAMIEDGCLDNVDVIYGAHVWTPASYGTVWLCDGYITAASDQFSIQVNGKGGHGSEPHRSIDPILTGSHLVIQLQQIVSRMIDPQQSAVVHVGSVHSGSANNIIPETMDILGSVRTFEEETRTEIEKRIRQISYSVCEGVRAECTVNYRRGYPPVWNDPLETSRVEEAVKQLIGEQCVKRIEPLMIGEDFAYYAKKIPGVFFFVGAGNKEMNAEYPHHHPRFDADERSMLITAKTFISLVTGDA